MHIVLSWYVLLILLAAAFTLGWLVRNNNKGYKIKSNDAKS
jgi:hypothetical protein